MNLRIRSLALSLLSSCLLAETPSTPINYEFYPETLSDEFDFRFELSLQTKKAAAVIAANWQSDRNHYRIRFGKDSITLKKTQEGVSLPLGWSDLKIALGTDTHKVVLKRRRDSLRLYIDDILTAEAHDSMFRKGKLGVYVSSEDVQVKRARYQPVEEVYFSDDFMREAAHSDWQGVSGEWEQQAVRSNVSMSANSFTYQGLGTPGISVTGNRFWDSYRFRASMQMPMTGQAGLVAGYQDEKNYYLLRWSIPKWQLEILVVNNGRQSVLARRRLPCVAGHWYRMSLSFVPGLLEASVDGYPQISAKDSTFSEGRAGLYVESDDVAIFDDVEIVRDREVRDSFEGRASGLWQPLLGDWKKLQTPFGGVLPGDPCMSVTGEAPAKLLLQHRPGSWYLFEVDTFARSGQFGVCFDYFDERNFWMAKCSPDGVELLQTHEGKTIIHDRTDLKLLPAVRRIGVRVRDNVAEILLDGRTILSGVSSSNLTGSAGLFAAHARHVTFDNVRLSFPSPPQPVFIQHEVFGREKTMTNWAAAQSDWVVRERFGREMQWHRGSFPGDVTLGVRLTQPARNSFSILICIGGADEQTNAGCILEATFGDRPKLRLIYKDNVISEREGISLKSPAILSFSRRGKFFIAALDDEPLLQARPGVPIPGDQVGWVTGDYSLSAKDIEIRSANCEVHTFHTAPVDWVPTSGQWQGTNRWQCDPRWSFFSGVSNELASLWNKKRYRGHVTVEFAAGIKMDNSRGGGNYTNYASDINIALGGDGNDITSGYNLVFGGWGNSVTRILRNNTIVAETSSTVIPTGDLHRRWLYLKGERRGSLIRLSVDNKLVLEFDDPNPLPGDRVGIWTWHNGVMVARVRVSGSDVVEPSMPNGQTEAWSISPYNHPSQPGALQSQLDRLKAAEFNERADAAIQLGLLHDPAAIPHLVPLLEVEDDNCRWQAAKALTAIGLPGIKALLESLKNEDEKVRWKIEAALRQCDAVAVPLVASTLQNGEDLQRRSCAFLLRDIPCPETYRTLCTALGDGDEDVRWKAADSLFKLGSETIPEVVRTLRSESTRARQAAAWVLQKFGGKAPIASLLGCLDDPDKDVRWKAAIALKQLDPRPEKQIVLAYSAATVIPRTHLEWLLKEWNSPLLKSLAKTKSATAASSGKSTQQGIQFTFKSEPAGANVFVDHQFIGSTPGKFQVSSPGTHLVRMVRKGHLLWSQPVKLRNRGKVRARLEAIKNLTLTVSTIPPGAAVHLDNQFKGSSPLSIRKLSPGSHELRIEKESFLPVKQQLQLPPGSDERINIKLISKSEEFYRKALKANPNNVSYLTELAHVYILRNEFERAKKQLLEAYRLVERGEDSSDYASRLNQEIDKANSGFYDYGGSDALEKGRRTLEDLFSQLIQEFPGSSSYWIYYASFLEQRKGIEEAEEVLKRATRHVGKNWQVYYQLGVLQHKLAANGRNKYKAEALKNLNAALGMTSNEKHLKSIQQHIKAVEQLR